MEGSNFRQVARLVRLLMRMKGHERQMEAFEQDDEKHGSADPAGQVSRSSTREKCRPRLVGSALLRGGGLP
jgi:hypothetical protein